MRIPDAVHEELLNWSRWCWLGAWPHPLPPTHCGSLESQYRAPPDWNPDDAPEAPYIRPNERNARRVQEVYNLLPGPQRQVLKAEYPGRSTSGRTEGKATAAARLGMPEWAYDRHLQAAINRVEEAFAVRA
jgi:hypothetical protein